MGNLAEKVDMCPLNQGLYLRTIGTVKTAHYTEEEEEKYGGIRYFRGYLSIEVNGRISVQKQPFCGSSAVLLPHLHNFLMY